MCTCEHWLFASDEEIGVVQGTPSEGSGGLSVYRRVSGTVRDPW